MSSHSRIHTGKKSVTCSRSFGVPVESLDELREAVALYRTRAAERMRKHGMTAGALTVFIHTNRFSNEPQYGNAATFELACATDTTDELLAWALKGLTQIYRSGFRYKKAGVMLLDLKPTERLTARLFGQADFERAQRVVRAMDEINRRLGRDTIRFGVVKPAGRWQTKALRRSRRYTTCLREVLHVK